MSIQTYLPRTGTTPQTAPLPGQRANHAGGYSYTLDPWAVLRRFLILGSEGGTFYVGQDVLTAEHLAHTEACLRQDGPRAVAVICEVSDQGLAPSNTPCEVALALAASIDMTSSDPRHAETRRVALLALPRVCRIPTHLFHFLRVLKTRRGLGSAVKKAVRAWYGRWTEDQLAFEVAKYQQRDGMSHRDVLRLVRPRGQNTVTWRFALGVSKDARTVTRRVGRSGVIYPATTAEPKILEGLRLAQEAKGSPARCADLIRTYGLTREMVPSEVLTAPEVWDALLDRMPLGALVRNLGTMSKTGLLTPLSDAATRVCARLSDPQALRKARLHPLAILMALKTYGDGKGLKGAGRWTPVQPVVEALDAAFYQAFPTVPPTGQRLLFALDVSGSMSSAVAGKTNLTCAEATAVLAMVCARTEARYHIMGFTSELVSLGITARDTLRDAMRKVVANNFGSTDCAVPAQWALQERVPVDGIVILTDSETWFGDTHPAVALARYREAMQIPVKQVVVGMVPTPFTIADPQDPLSLDVVGFDTSVPGVITEFLRG